MVFFRPPPLLYTLSDEISTAKPMELNIYDRYLIQHLSL